MDDPDIYNHRTIFFHSKNLSSTSQGLFLIHFNLQAQSIHVIYSVKSTCDATDTHSGCFNSACYHPKGGMVMGRDIWLLSSLYWVFVLHHIMHNDVLWPVKIYAASKFSQFTCQGQMSQKSYFGSCLEMFLSFSLFVSTCLRYTIHHIEHGKLEAWIHVFQFLK